ncbi:MAG: pilus assembly protein PilM [Anaerolineaceae bacterium]|nr:pilus assembly protein PilM [Anaerolineaceae bacterium]
MRPVFSDLQTEIQRSIGFYTSLHRESRIERLLAMGSTFRLPGLQKYLSQNLGVEVTKVDHFSSLGGDQVTGAPVFKENVLSFGVAYGLALQGLGLGAIATSLLPPEILKEKELKRKRPFVVAAAAAVVVGFALLGIGANQSLKATGRPADAPLDIGDPDRPVKNVLKAVESFVSENQKSVTAVAANKMALKEKQKELDQYTQLEKYRDLWYTILTDVWTLTTSGPQQEAYRQWDPRKPHTDWENLEIVEITDLWSEFTNAEPASDEIGRTPGSTIGGGSKTPIMIVNIRGTAPMKRGQTPALIVEERLINKLLQTRAIYDELVSKLKTGGLGAELIDKLKTGVVDAELAGKLQSLGISPKLIERLKSRARGGYIQGIKMEEVGIYRGHQDYPYEKEKPVEGAEGAQPGEMRRTTSSGTGKEEDQVQPKRPWRGDDVSFLVRFFINLDDPSKAVEYTYANLAKRDGPSYQ